MGRNCAETAPVAFLRQVSASATRCCHGQARSGRAHLASHARRSCAAATAAAAAAAVPASRLGRRAYSSSSQASPTTAVEDDDTSVAVLGGGLTGLSTAYYLAKKLPPTAKITLYEASNRLGGWVRTEEFDVDVGGKKGTIAFERGPRTLSSLANSSWRFDDLVLYDLMLDLGLKPHFPSDGRRRIFFPDHLVNLPPHGSLLRMALEPLAWSTFPGLARLWYRYTFQQPQLPGIPAKDESVADWLRHLTGSDAVADHLTSAVLHGIYGGDITKLSARTVLEQFYYRWHVMKAPDDKVYTSDLNIPITSLFDDKAIQELAQRPKGNMLNMGAAGMESLTSALAHTLASQPNVEIKLGERVRNLSFREHDKMPGIITTRTGRTPRLYSKVISTIAGQHLASITGGNLPSLAKLKSTSITAVNLYFPGIEPTGNDLGYLIPRSVDPTQNPERALGVFFDSSAIPLRPGEPTGLKLFVLMGGHYYDPESNGGRAVEHPDEVTAIEQARALLERHLGISREEPCFAVAAYNKECIPQHHVGHGELMVNAHRELVDGFDGTLAVAGGSYTPIGTVAGLAAGFRAAHAFAGPNPEPLQTGLEHFTQLSSLLLSKDSVANVRPRPRER